MKQLVSKSVYIVLAVCFLLLGLVGLVIPVLPGVIFLFVALIFLGKASVRIRTWLDSQEWVRKLEWSARKARLLSWADRLRLSGWMMLQTLSNGLQTVVNWIRRIS